MRRLRRNRFGRQNKILLVATLGLFSILTIGYAAFQTNITLTAKGNAKPSATYTVSQLKETVGTCGNGEFVADPNESGRYVYRGADPCNYLTLNNETWRIMSIESDNTLKIIRDDSIGIVSFDPGKTTTISGITTNGSNDGTRYSTTSTDFCYNASDNYGCKVWGSKDTMRNSEGTLLKDTPGGAKMSRIINSTTYNLPNDEAYLNVYLNGGTYAGVTVTGWYQTWSSNLNSTIESYIEDEHTYNVGLVSSTSGQLTATDIVQEKALTWKGRVGLLTASEYVRASSNSACTGIRAYYNTSSCYNNSISHNYLHKADLQGNTKWWWTISPVSISYTYRMWFVDAATSGLRSDVYLYTPRHVRPVLYLSSNTILKGDGTSGRKFQIANTSPNPDSGGGSGGGGGSSNTVYAINSNTIIKDSSTLQDIGTTYPSCTATGKNICLKYTIENNIVTGVEACFVKGGTEYCLQGGVDECLYDENLRTCTYAGPTTVYNANKGILNTAFTETNACSDYDYAYDCGDSSFGGLVDYYGGAITSNTSNTQGQCGANSTDSRCNFYA